VLDGRGHNRFGSLRRRDVGNDADATPRPLQRRYRGVEVVSSARAEQNVSALLDKPRCDSATNPPARAGDEGNLSYQPEIHGTILRAGHPTSRVEPSFLDLVPHDESVAGFEAELAHDRSRDCGEDERNDGSSPSSRLTATARARATVSISTPTR